MGPGYTMLRPWYNSLIRVQKFNKHIANGYRKLLRAFKREAVQFLGAKNVAVNH